MRQLMYYSKNTGYITKNALGDRYDDFVKHDFYLFFVRKKYASHQSPRPYRTPQTRANDGTSCLLPKNTGSTTKDALGDWYDDSLNDVMIR